MSFFRNKIQGTQITFKQKQQPLNAYNTASQLGYDNPTTSVNQITTQYKTNSVNMQTQGKLLFQNVAIVSKKAQKVLDVCQDKDTKGMLIIYEDCNQTNQRFNIVKYSEYVMLISRQTGKALTVAGNSQKNGAPIIQQPVSGLIGQKFRLALLQNGEYIIHTFCGKALDCCEQRTTNGTPVIQWKFDRKDHQKWLIRS